MASNSPGIPHSQSNTWPKTIMLPAKHQSRVRSRTVRQIALRVDREQQRFQALPTIYSSPEIRRQLNVGSTAEASVPTKEMNRSKNPRPPQNAGLGNPSNQTTVHCCYSENSSRTHPRDWPIRQLAQRRVRCRPPPAVCPPSLLVAGASNVVLPIEPCDDCGARTRVPLPADRTLQPAGIGVSGL